MVTMRLLPWRSAAFAGAVGVLMALTAGATLISFQAVCAAFLVALPLLARRYSRAGSLGMVWALWLFIPGLRRGFELLQPAGTADPLALVPFLATAGLAILELPRVHLSARARRLLVVVAIGYLIGLPSGVSNAQGAAFALAAYGAALAAFVFGYAERHRRVDDLGLTRALLWAAPILALYGLSQYFLPLTGWDQHWLDAVQLASIQSPEAGHIRIFSTLNAPSVLAAVLGLGLLYLAVSRRPGALRLGLALPILTALGLTYVRGVWIALAVGAIVLIIAGGTRAVLPVLLMLTICVGAVEGLSGSNATAAAVSHRFETLVGLSSDVSSNDRQENASSLFPEALTSPLGHGLGQAGEATKLGGSERLKDSDNGYLALAWQVGPLGFVLIVGALLWILGVAVRAAQRRPREALFPFLLALYVFLLVSLFATDALYGVTGVIFWYVAGALLAADEAAHRSDPKPTRALTGVERRPVPTTL